MRRVVAIHQPNFFPWLGFFDKLARADVFVLLDDVQFPRTGAGTPVNRVKTMVANRPRWITAPILRSGSATRQIRDVQLDDSQRWRVRIERTILFNYARSPGFDEVFPLVRELLATPTSSLADFNERCIRGLADALELGTELVRSSSFAVDSRGTQRLVELVDAVGGSVYLCGDGSESYLDVETFRRHGLGLVFQEFRHPEWPQRPPRMTAGLSIVDVLMRCGIERTRELVTAARGVSAARTAAA